MKVQLAHHELPWRQRAEWDRAIALLDDHFRTFRFHLREVAAFAAEVAAQTSLASQFIEANTAQICPSCQSVCCINRHGNYDFFDLIYLVARGLRPPAYEENIDDTSPCRFLILTGCRLPRADRPFRCNWHFCTALIDHLCDGPARPFRNSSARFQEIQRLRRAMLEEFFRVLEATNPQALEQIQALLLSSPAISA